MTNSELANEVQRSLNSLTMLEIKATETNMTHLYGAMEVLCRVRDALKEKPEEGAESGRVD